MHCDLKALDLVWSGAYIVRNHGYLVYDTLFALAANFHVQPRMAEPWRQSEDGRLTIKKGPPSEGGWNAFATSWARVDILDPLMTPLLAATCEKTRAGWPCDASMETVRHLCAQPTLLSSGRLLNGRRPSTPHRRDAHPIGRVVWRLDSAQQYRHASGTAARDGVLGLNQAVGSRCRDRKAPQAGAHVELPPAKSLWPRSVP
jgi:hypothetical protein